MPSSGTDGQHLEARSPSPTHCDLTPTAAVSQNPAVKEASAQPSTCTAHGPADKLRSLSILLAQLAAHCNRDLLVQSHAAGSGPSVDGANEPIVVDLIDRVESAVNDLAAALASHAEGPASDERIGRSSQRPQSTGGSPSPRSVTPRPVPSSKPSSTLSLYPSNAACQPLSASSPALPETPTRPPPSASDVALERSLASLSIDTGSANTIQDRDPTSPSLEAAAAAATKSKAKSARTSSQLTPSSAVHAPKRSRQSLTPPSRPRFSLGVFSRTSGISFVRTPVNLPSPTRSQRASSSPASLLVPECTPPRPASLDPSSPSRNSGRHSVASPTPKTHSNHINDDSAGDDDDDPIVFVSSTPAPNPPTKQRTVVILSDSDSSPSPSTATRPPPPSTPSFRTPRRPVVSIDLSDSDSHSDPAPGTPTRRAPIRAQAGASRNTPRRTGGAIQKKIELLRTRFTPRRDDGGMVGGAGRVRRAVVVVGSDEEEGDEDHARDSGEDASGLDGEEGEWSDRAQGDESVYDSSFIDDSDDDVDEGMDRKAKPTPKGRDAPRVPATPTTPALTSTAFKRARDSLTAQAFTEFNQRVFDNQLPSNLAIEWNKRLCTTAGRAWPSRFKPSTDRPVPTERKVADDGWVYDARVELSVKVLDSEEKLRRTLLHELCHVAAWVLDHVAKPPHGPRFWHWAKRATRAFPQLEVTTCHDYTINFKYTYVCTVCGYAFGRHSKSVDVQRQACGACNGGKLRLQVAGGSQVQEQPTSTRKPSAYQVFVKERYGQVKQAGKSHKEVMQALSEMWAKEGKQTGTAGDESMTAA